MRISLLHVAVGINLVATLAGPLRADNSLLTVRDRYAVSPKEEVPDFQRHVVPLLGRLGCNGRECHGSFQGQGGFRLSLFGYDFDADHKALTGGERPRANPQDPAGSLILKKPTLAIDHEGGERFETGGWEHRLLKRWIEVGAPNVSPGAAKLTSLDVEPGEIVFAEEHHSQPLKIVARWSDGTREDVTPLCRFRSNDESIATVSPTGLVNSQGAGDTHVVVFYDNGIAPVPVIRPVSKQVGPQYPAVPTPTKIDELVVQKLRKVGIVPAALCTDAEFLRRVSLDLTGTLPTTLEITAFLEEESPDKRTKKIEELLSRPTYAAWWATRLGDWMGNTEENLPVGGEQRLRRVKSAQWYDWIGQRLAHNTPYDQIIAGILLATSRPPEQSTQDYYAEMSSYFREKNPGNFADRSTMPYFWTRGRFTPPQPLRFSYAFLGIRLECAQCHKHPYDQWTQADYEEFQVFFEGVGYNYSNRRTAQDLKNRLGLTADQDSGGYKNLFAKLASEGTIVPWEEVTVPSLARSLEKRQRQAKSKGALAGGRVFTPKLLGGKKVLADEYDDAREPLMEWLRHKENPYFARTLVNRVWATYFGVGIVDPPDDMNLANPPSNAALLDYLAEEFIKQGYDLKWLHREIAGSRAYQLSWRPNETNKLDERNFSRALVRRLPAEAAYDALVHATAAESIQQAMHDNAKVVRERAIGVSSGYSRGEKDYVMNLFGKPARDGICDCQRSNEPSLLQTVYLRNDGELLKLLDRKDGWLQHVANREPAWRASHKDQLIQEAYLRTFCRMPTEQESATALECLEQANDSEGLHDLLWALLNSKEFLLNH